MEDFILLRHKQIYNEVIARFNKTTYFRSGAYDETLFTPQVYRVARQILKKVKADEELVLISCLVHDLGKTVLDKKKLFNGPKKDQKLWNTHPKAGVKPTKEILESLNYEKEFIKKVCHIVENHARTKDFKGDKTIELQIVQDADILADGGIIGMIRPFLFSGEFKLNTINQIKFAAEEKGRSECLDELNLKISIKIAKRMYKEEQLLKNKLKKLLK